MGKITHDRRELKNWFLEFKRGLSCQMCGESHEACIHFHHRDSSTKRMSVSKMVNAGLSKEDILTEIAKCDILCSNCHLKVHWELERATFW